MKQLERMQSSLPDDIALKIVSCLQVKDVCSLGSCSRFWRVICRSNYVWEYLAKERWPFLALVQNPNCSTTEGDTNEESLFQGWRNFYRRQHNYMAGRATAIVKFVEECSLSESLEAGDYLKAIEDMRSMQLGFMDVHFFLFKPNLNVLLNLLGLHYCIDWLQVPAASISEALHSSKISDRQVCVKWWKLGRWINGFRLRDESRSHWVSLEDLVNKRENIEVLSVLHRGAIHEVLRVQISTADPNSSPWSWQSTLRLRQ